MMRNSLILLSQVTPVTTSTKIGENELYNVFDKRTSTLLYEYYIMQIFTEYINLTKDPIMASQMLKPLATEKTSLYSNDFLVEQQLQLAESEDLYLEGNVDKLQEDTARLLVTYLTIMMKTKKSIDLSYDKVDDLIFKLKEAEKYTFTDRLRDLDDEQREVENVLKIYKLGVWSKGLQKGLTVYDKDTYDEDRDEMEKLVNIENKLLKRKQSAGAGSGEAIDDLDRMEYMETEQRENEIDAEDNDLTNLNDNYDEEYGNGDEQEYEADLIEE